jgi:hypothetical protein
MFSSYIKNIDTMANTSQPSTLPSRKKNHHQNLNLSISLPALPHKDKKSPVANKKYSAFGR